MAQPARAPAPTTKPIISRRSFPPGHAPLTDLPFIADIGRGRDKRRCHWNVPDTDDYCRANEMGRQFAADFAQYLKQNPCLVGSCVVGDIIRDMAQDRRVDATYGYGVGFFAFLEKLIYIAAKHADLYAIAEREAQHYAAIKASEAEAEGGVA